jgi:hypothetical protein
VKTSDHSKYRSGHWPDRARWAGVLALGLLLCGFERSAAATQCLTAPVELPNLPGVPNWFGPGSAADPWRAQLNDPRWSGAAPFSLCTSPDLSACAVGLEQAEFRVLADDAKLYIALHVMADDVTNGDDAVFIGVGPSIGSEAVAAMIVPDTSAARIIAVGEGIVSDPTPPVKNSAEATTKTWYATLANAVRNWRVGLPPGVSSPWLQDVATWTNSPGVSWAITAVVDLAKLGYSLQQMRLFVGTRFVLSTNGAVTLPTPANAAQTIGYRGSTAETIIPATKSSWTQFDPPGDCTDGVLLTGSDIGVWVGSDPLSSQIKTCPPAGYTGTLPDGCPNQQNEFQVKPREVPTPYYSTSFGVRAKIHLSNWGLLPGDWTQAPWQQLANGCDGTQTGWTWENGAGDGPTGRPTIQYQCPLSAGSTYCPEVSTGSVTPDQAMLVELCPNNNIRFHQMAAYRNMTFTTLSSRTDTATLVLPPVAQGLVDSPREVQVLVRTYNMPEPSATKIQLPSKAMQAVLDYAIRPPPRPPFKLITKRPSSTPRGPVPTSNANKAPLPAMRTQQVSSFLGARTTDLKAAALAKQEHNPLTVPTLTAQSAFRQVWPTYMVYGYIVKPTDKPTMVNGKPRAVLEPMVPYGYYLKHDQAFYGFTHSLSTTAAVLPEPRRRPGVFRLFIPADRPSIQLTTNLATVDSLEPSKPPPPPPPPPPAAKNPNPTARSHCFCDVPGRMTSHAAAFGLAAVVLALALRVRRARRSRRKPRA